MLGNLFSLSVKPKEAAKEEAETVLRLLKTREGAAKAKLRRLYDLYGDSGDEMLREAILAQKKSLSALSMQIRDEESVQKRAEEIRRVGREIGEIRESWPYLSMREKKKIVRSCVEKIVVTDDVVDVYYTFETK